MTNIYVSAEKRYNIIIVILIVVKTETVVVNDESWDILMFYKYGTRQDSGHPS